MADANGNTHVCAYCNETHPASNFKARKDGSLGGRCKACMTAYKAAHYEANKQKYKDRAQQWRTDNRERYIENNKAYYRENREAIIAQCVAIHRSEYHLKRRAKWAAENKDKRLAAEQAYRDRNRDACNGRIREWKKQNPYLVAAYSRRRSNRVRAHTPQWASIEAMARFYEEAARLTLETGIEHHVDHIVPIISDLVCGFHCEANLQVLRYDDNVRKGNRWWPDMP